MMTTLLPKGCRMWRIVVWSEGTLNINETAEINCRHLNDDRLMGHKEILRNIKENYPIVKIINAVYSKSS